MLIYPGHSPFIFFKGGVFLKGIIYSNLPKFKFIEQENAATLRHSSVEFISHKPTCGKNTLHLTAAIWASHGVSPRKISFKQKKGDWTKLDPTPWISKGW